MPYLPDLDRRKELFPLIIPEDTGEMNYIVSMLMQEYVLRHGLSYKTLSEARAGVNDALDEFYRRIVAPYEDRKIRLNKDVFSPRLHRLIQKTRRPKDKR